jgi:hypothetical protein
VEIPRALIAEADRGMRVYLWQTMKSTATMTEAMKGATRAMMAMNRQVNMPAMQHIMMEFEKQGEIMEMKVLTTPPKQTEQPNKPSGSFPPHAGHPLLRLFEAHYVGRCGPHNVQHAPVV